MSPVRGPALEKEVAAMLASVTDLPAAPEAGMGLGVDVEDHERWRNSELRVEALFTPTELAWCRARADLPAQLAGTWCAKEATVKAMALQFRLSLRDVEVLRDGLGRPSVRLLADDLQHHGDRVRVSISRTADISVAVAVYLPTTGPASPS